MHCFNLYKKIRGELTRTAELIYLEDSYLRYIKVNGSLAYNTYLSPSSNATLVVQYYYPVWENDFLVGIIIGDVIDGIFPLGIGSTQERRIEPIRGSADKADFTIRGLRDLT